MPIEFQPRGRVSERNRLGPAYYAALYEDDPLEPDIFPEATMPGRGILSYPDQFDDAVGQEAAAARPIHAPSRVLGVDIDAAQAEGQAMAPGEGNPGAPTVFSPLGDLFFQESANDAGPAREGPAGHVPAVLSPIGDVFFQESANDAAPAWKGTIGHAEGAEALIPIWGAGRNLLADLEEKNYAGAALNAALLASDFFLWGAPARLIYKAGVAGFKKDGLKGVLDGSKYAIQGPGSPDVKDKWSYAKYRMKKYDMLHSPNEGHHSFIPQGDWGKNWPDAIKHHPFNIMELPKPVHRRLHTRWLGQPRYNPIQRYWYGKPRWFKALNAEMAGHSIEGYRSYQRTHEPYGPGAGPSMGATKYRPAPYD